MPGEDLDSPLHAEQEFRAIETALLETPRGRWFLAEHSRRSRRLESAEIDEAIGRLKSSLRDPPAVLGRLRTELDSIAQVLRQARSAVLTRFPASPPNQTDRPLAPMKRHRRPVC